MKIGILGGTFDPVHLAHLHIANAALLEYRLDSVWFMPAKLPPHKLEKHITSETDRLTMLELATANNQKLKVKNYELEWNKISYTVDTLTWLKKKFPMDEFFYILGEDSLQGFPTWFHPEEIASMVDILVAERENGDGEAFEILLEERNRQFGDAFKRLHTKLLPFSSTAIRECVKNGKPIHDMVSDEVERYIMEKGLYQQEIT